MSQPLVKNVAIIGAGLGGLACAIALRKLGINVQIYEKAKEFRPVGGGLGLLPNGLSCLEEISPGIVETLKKVGCEIHQIVLKNTEGETLSANTTTYVEKYGQPFISIWWYRLQQALAEKLPLEIIHLHHNCMGFEQNNTGVKIFFAGDKTVEADLLIGADGLHSAVRKTLVGDGAYKVRRATANTAPYEPLNYLGSMSWRAVIQYEQSLVNPHEAVFIRGNKQFMYILNLGDGYIGWITRKLTPDNYYLSDNSALVKSRVLQDLAAWGEPIRTMVKATEDEKIIEVPIFDRPPLSNWSKGRVTLLGDAAHPMAPALGQGANTTFEDAYELARCLSQASSIEQAFADYEKCRRERTAAIQARSALSEMLYYENNNRNTTSEQEFRHLISSYKPTLPLN